MKALSIQQPWAWLIVNGYKDIENRSWPAYLRETIAIHAGKKFDAEGYDWVADNFVDIDLPEPPFYDYGGIVGTATIVDCVRKHDSEWFVGPYGIVLRNAKLLPFRPVRGMLGFFDVPDYTLIQRGSHSNSQGTEHG